MRLRMLLAAAAAVAVLGRLSWWQWERAQVRGSLLNYTYAVEWLLLAAAVAIAPLVRRRPGSTGGDEASRDVSGRLLGPPLRPGEQVGETTPARLRRWASRWGGFQR
jgi:hypothetical protein